MVGVGYVDSISRSGIRGWVGSKAGSPELHIVVDGCLAATAKCDLMRRDVANAGLSHAACGFDLQWRAEVLGARLTRVSIVSRDGKNLLDSDTYLWLGDEVAVAGSSTPERLPAGRLADFAATVRHADLAQRLMRRLQGQFGALGARPFVVAVYSVVLGRYPDPRGYEHYVNRMDAGDLTHLEFISDVLDSEEAKRSPRLSLSILQGSTWGA